MALSERNDGDPTLTTMAVPVVPGAKGFAGWLMGARDSARLAYLLTLGTRVFSSFVGLIWTRLLVAAMGTELNGVYLAFQKVITLGGLGDLGMGGAVAVRAGQYLGQGKRDELERFLASARTVFLLLAFLVGGVFLLTSHWLPGWLRFQSVPGAGSLHLLFALGAFLIAAVLLASYVSSLNYACGNVTWPVVPAFVLLQLSFFGNWLLARHHQPLWVQYLPAVGSAVIGICLTRFYVRVSHPPLARVFPLDLDWALTVSLLEGSVWTYLCTLGNAIYRTTDGLVINAGFPPGTLVPYEYNYKFCELVVFLVLTASFVSLPKITQWMASADPADRQRLAGETRRLNQFQTLLGFGAALAYLAGNGLFMRLWWWHGRNPVLPAPLPLQIAFALNLAVTAGGDTAIQLALRSGARGLRVAGTTVGLTGLLNLGLSIVAMKMSSLWGIAMATVVAQSILSIVTAFYTCQRMGISWLPWLLRGWFLPVLGISLAGWLRMELEPLDSLPKILSLVGAFTAVLLAAAWGLGVDSSMMRDEVRLIRGLIRR